MIKLSPRLSGIAEFIKDDCSMVDIGCDHGLLDIYLVQNKKNIQVIASDVNENALNNAKKNIKKYQVEDKMSVV
ncbi:MAG: tRNA (adenine(22)-N(1))-methyltransferase TrmK, partial [Bacilli bacterium]|nr:tRNA (adenine(22)-N(1))-methyltransferase TrmK [Bacilli bacterium]